ncbi:hypothetical protein GCM10027435_28230 [Haloparvum alkalitolerans]|uniref:DUF5810 domain-containing protein n=1 Tax=Haloparvum alkalitolerans TaxID=1042953 RepID=UPI003CEE1FB6
MGYACPVCDLPQRDGEHLAHHLAFTAMLHGDDHETWLDEHADAWSDSTPAELAGEVTPHAEEVETEDGDGHDHQHGHGQGHGQEPGRPDVGPLGGGAGGLGAGGTGRGAGAASGGPGRDDPEVQQVLREARELTERMLDDGDGADDDASGSEDDA